MYYIKGNRERGAEVIKALVDKGGRNTCEYLGVDDSAFYYIDKNCIIREVIGAGFVGSVLYYLLTELTLPEPEWMPTRGETVLVRNSDNENWHEAVFSYYDDNKSFYPYSIVGGQSFRYCIPFDINKLGKVK